MHTIAPCLLAATLLALLIPARAADEPKFYPPDPDGLSAYTLPDPMKTADGTAVTTKDDWIGRRRAEVLELFRANVFGRVPDTKAEIRHEVVEENRAALEGTATLRRIRFTVSRGTNSIAFTVVLFVPNQPPKPVPVFLLICNRGAEIIDPAGGNTNEFWSVREIIGRGYATAAFQVGEVDPDDPKGYAHGVRALLDNSPRGPDAWGSIGAWAWASSRIVDYLETDPDLAKGRIAIIGHSRGGKTALWAAAQDERFALACINESGCGGANLLRRRFEGRESVARITRAFPHWFAPKFATFANREDDLPIDHHMLLALVAPRTVHVGSAAADRWADPRGEFLGLVHAAPVYALFGKKGLGTDVMPAIGTPLQGDGMAYHIRAGVHNLTLEDWRAYLDTADRLFRSTDERP